MKFISFLIKPASGLCNMRCKYCFYNDIAQSREIESYGIMTQGTAKALIDAAFNSLDEQGTVSFMFQGGEPTLAGLSFFKSFVVLVNKRRKAGMSVNYSIQTNGLEINDSWALFLKENNFLTGISIDADRDLHDLYRLDAKGDGTYSRAAKAFERLIKCGAEVNALCVVTQQCAKHPRRAYSALKRLGAKYIQFIPCLDELAKPFGGNKFSLKPEAYASFLCAVFDEWFSDWESGKYVSVRLFEDYVLLATGQQAGTCATNGSCGAYMVAEADGSIYPCDFYVLDKWKLGSILCSSPEQLLESQKAAEFASFGKANPTECAACKWFLLCGGGCKRNKIIEDGEIRNYMCPALKVFFEHTAPRIFYIAKAELKMRGRL